MYSKPYRGLNFFIHSLSHRTDPISYLETIKRSSKTEQKNLFLAKNQDGYSLLHSIVAHRGIRGDKKVALVRGLISIAFKTFENEPKHLVDFITSGNDYGFTPLHSSVAKINDTNEVTRLLLTYTKLAHIRLEEQTALDPQKQQVQNRLTKYASKPSYNGHSSITTYRSYDKKPSYQWREFRQKSRNYDPITKIMTKMGSNSASHAL